MKRHDRIAGRAGEPNHARLRDTCGPARAVDRERSRTAGGHVFAQLNQRANAAARRRAAGRAVTKSSDDACDPFAIEIFARNDDDAAIAKVECRGEDAAVPERKNRRTSFTREIGQVLGP